MRRITCLDCGQVRPTPPEDIAAGLIERRTRGKSTRHLNCDYCNKPIDPGDEAVAFSLPADMREWESDYITK